MKSFSLLSLLLFVVVAALIVSQVVMMRQLAAARAEVDSVRRKFGYVRVKNEKLTYVARIQDDEQHVNAYRIHVPSGRHYMLHLTDTTIPTSNGPTDPQPTSTISLNGWKEGADVVLSYSIQIEGAARRVIVHTETEEFFDYRMDDWVASGMEGSHLQTNPQLGFSPDETINFMWQRDPQTQRGVILWMELVAKWEARRAAKKNATEQSQSMQPATGPDSDGNR